VLLLIFFLGIPGFFFFFFSYSRFLEFLCQLLFFKIGKKKYPVSKNDTLPLYY
jgi:hypothetical protein